MTKEELRFTINGVPIFIKGPAHVELTAGVLTITVRDTLAKAMADQVQQISTMMSDVVMSDAAGGPLCAPSEMLRTGWFWLDKLGLRRMRLMFGGTREASEHDVGGDGRNVDRVAQ